MQPLLWFWGPGAPVGTVGTVGTVAGGVGAMEGVGMALTCLIGLGALARVCVCVWVGALGRACVRACVRVWGWGGWAPWKVSVCRSRV